MLYNLQTNKKIIKYNEKRCQKQIPADSTFKIALSLMAYNENIINNKTIFTWDKKERWLKEWNQNQTPRTWMKYSAVWVSQFITPQLGILKIKDYLQKFNYGNQDFSGDLGKNNGLTNAWLNSSLKISGDEELSFLINMFQFKLSISHDAIKNTWQNMYIENNQKVDDSLYGTHFDFIKNNWQLFAKTGSNGSTGIRDGWFVGIAQKDHQKYIFVTNFSDTKPIHDNISGGGVAKGITIKLLNQFLK